MRKSGKREKVKGKGKKTGKREREKNWKKGKRKKTKERKYRKKEEEKEKEKSRKHYLRRIRDLHRATCDDFRWVEQRRVQLRVPSSPTSTESPTTSAPPHSVPRSSPISGALV